MPSISARSCGSYLELAVSRRIHHQPASSLRRRCRVFLRRKIRRMAAERMGLLSGLQGELSVRNRRWMRFRLNDLVKRTGELQVKLHRFVPRELEKTSPKWNWRMDRRDCRRSRTQTALLG